jgi:hypothetical protein
MISKFALLGVPAVYYALNTNQAQCEGQMPPPPSQSQSPPKKSTPASEAEELQRILEENPYAATDPEEMERILQSKNKNKLKKPAQFSKLMIPIKIMTQCEALDGLRFDVSGGLSERFQLGGSWNFSNTKPSNFSINTMLHSKMDQFSNDGMNFINCKKDVVGKMEFVSNFHITSDLTFKAEGFFPNANVETSHISYEVMKEFADWHLSGKFGGGSYSVSMMQSVTPQLSGGFEAMWHPQLRDFIFNYGAKYSVGNHTILGQYIPIAKKDAI